MPLDWWHSGGVGLRRVSPRVASVRQQLLRRLLAVTDDPGAPGGGRGYVLTRSGGTRGADRPGSTIKESVIVDVVHIITSGEQTMQRQLAPSRRCWSWWAR